MRLEFAALAERLDAAEAGKEDPIERPRARCVPVELW
jgi:hypothetical protein